MRKKELFKFFFLFCFVCFLIGVCIVSTIFVYYSANLPRHTKLEDYQPSITSRFYSSDGKLLREYADEKRIFLSIENIPNLVKNAFISAEDKNFYKHRGLDPEALLSAIIYNVYAYINGLQFRGGSTITQQVVKNMLLTNERTLSRKINEAILSFRITKDFEKDKVLELYLNHIFLGNNSYGVAAAALTYFNKSLDDLSAEEAAVLASLPKAPGKLNPYINYKGSLARRNWVLERMYKDGHIDKTAFDKAVNSEIILNKRQDSEYFNAGAFVEEVRKKMLKTFNEESLMRDGLVVSTTIDPKIQQILDKNFKNGLESYDRRNGYRGALGNIYINNENNFHENWPMKLKEFKISEYYRNNWKRAVVLKMDDENKIIKIGLLNNNETINSFDNIKLINDIKVKESYILLNNIEWAIEPSLLNKKKISETGEEIKIEYKVNKTTDTNLFVGDIIFVEEKAKNGYLLKQAPLVNGGAVVLDVHNGKVLAMVGGYIDSEINFNRVTQAKRQPGSSIKPFIYLSAFENGYEPSDLIMDEEIVLPQGLGMPSYKPRNFNKDTYYGLVTLRRALQNSYNVSTVRLASEVGLNKITETIKRFGINKQPKKIYSVALGSLESYLINMTRAYAMLINGGRYIDIETVEKVQDKFGKTIFKRDNRICQKCLASNEKNIEEIEVPFIEDKRQTITDSASAYQIVSILEGVVKYGTAWRVKSIGKNIGGKTGTSNDFRDAWFIGFSPDIVLGIYIGFDDNRSLGENETGAKAATPIFVNTMKEILQDKESIPFRIPENIKLKKIDMTTGQAPTLISIDKNIIFEALKINNEKRKTENSEKLKEKQDIEINNENLEEQNDYNDVTNLVF